MFSDQKPTASVNELNRFHRSRKRTHVSENHPRAEQQQVKIRNSTKEASDLIGLFHGLALFDEQTEKVNVKDIICQEFVDRFGNLYKPVKMEQNSNTNQVTVNEQFNNSDGTSKNINNEICEKHQWSNNLLIEYDFVCFQEEMLKKYSEELLLPFSNFEDVVMGLAVINLGEAFSNNESLSRTLCEYINNLSNKTVGNVLYDGDSEYDSDTCMGNFNTHKRKRRKLMSACPSLK